MDPASFFSRIFSRIPLVNRLSLRTKLVFSFLFVVIAGGILSSLIGTELVADTIISQARNKVRHDLSTAGLVYNQSLTRIRDIVQLTASGRSIPDYLESGRLRKLEEFLVKAAEGIRAGHPHPDGRPAARCFLRTHHPSTTGMTAAATRWCSGP